MITQDFKDYVRVNEKKQNRVSVREKLAAFREILTKEKNRERAREHQKDRGAVIMSSVFKRMVETLKCVIENITSKVSKAEKKEAFL